MGLDQWAFATDNKLVSGAFQIPSDFDVFNNSILLMQWCKHPDLHGWMRALYQQKSNRRLPTDDEGGKLHTYMEEEFNSGQGIELTADDLNALEVAIRDDMLPQTTGFFFGESCRDEDLDRDLAFIEKARHAINEHGLKVFYTSWW